MDETADVFPIHRICSVVFRRLEFTRYNNDISFFSNNNDKLHSELDLSKESKKTKWRIIFSISV